MMVRAILGILILGLFNVRLAAQVELEPNAFINALTRSNVGSNSLFWTSRNRSAFENNQTNLIASNTTWLNTNFASSFYNQVFAQAQFGLDNQSIGIQIWSSGWSASRINTLSLSYARRLSDKSAIAASYQFIRFSANQEESHHQANIRLDGSYRVSEKIELGAIIDGLIGHLGSQDNTIETQVGLSYSLTKDARSHLSFFTSNLDLEDISIGLEYRLADQFGLNLGIAFKAREFTFGPYFKLNDQLSTVFVCQVIQSASINLSLGMLYQLPTN